MQQRRMPPGISATHEATSLNFVREPTRQCAAKAPWPLRARREGGAISVNLILKRTPGLYVVGFMGSGKSTVGRLLADRLGWRFLDLDEEIERREATPISSIFSARGEAEFRRVETAALFYCVRTIECGQPAVVALGGGAFAEERNRDLLRDRGLSIWLDCPFETARRRAVGDPTRPLAQDPERFAALFGARRQAYSLADIHIAIESDEADAAVNAILAHPLIR
jgi:shikimate kinase